MAWIQKVTLSKANRAKLTAWITHVQQWHQALTAHDKARLANMVSDWGMPIRDIAKLKDSSLLKIFAVDYGNAWMTCALAGVKANASGLAVVVMWNYFVAPIFPVFVF